MNYYPHHIGDYLKDTAHLTMIEDGAYRRLIDLYYLHEQPLPADKRQVYRLARATSPAEKRAIDTILAEYFTLVDAGHAHRRCDAEIERSREKSNKAKQSAASRWQGKSHSEGNANAHANASRNAMRTHSEGNAYPITNNQDPKEETTTTPPPESREEPPPSSSPPPEKIPDEASSRAVQLAVILRRGGACQNTHATSRGMADLVELNATDAEALTALETAKRQRQAAGSAQAITVAYLVPIVRELRTKPPDKPQTAAQRRSAWSAEMADVIAQADPRQPREIDMGVIDATDLDQ